MSRFHAIVVLGLLVGCNDGIPMGEVTGTVTLDGQPVELAVIRFTSDFARPARGKVIDGKISDFSTFGGNDGVPVGAHRVVIQSAYDTVSNDQSISARNAPLRPVVEIPAKYAQLATTPFREEVVEGTNEYSFELTSK